MSFFKRNLPVFIIGFITLLIFGGIIIAGQNNKPNSPSLNEITSEDLITQHTYTRGPSDAPVTIVEFSDFECPYCGAMNPVMDSIFNKNSSSLRVAFRHFPLPQHPDSRKAAEAAQAAGSQGKFWEYVDVLFKNQQNLKEEDLIKYAGDLGLNTEQFTSDLKSGKYSQDINDDYQSATSLNLQGTPSFFLNGKEMTFTSGQDFENQINDAIKKYSQSSLNSTGSGLAQAKEPSNLAASTYSPESQLDTKESTETPTNTRIEVSYTNEGFSPKNLTATLGQTVRFTNNSDQAMTFEQTAEKFEEVGQDKTLQPGESFEVVLSKDKLWTYREKTSQAFGSIFVNTAQ